MKLILAITLLFTGTIASVQISIDNEADLDTVRGEGTTLSACKYVHNQGSLCKPGTVQSGASGFWSSCIEKQCDISISVGRLGELGQVPTGLSMLTYVQGLDADIQLRYRNIPDGIPMAAPGFKNIWNTKWDWSTLYDLSVLNLTSSSEIVLRLSSYTGADIIDKIFFMFTDDLPVDFECPNENGLNADPKNCRGFYNCANWYPYHFCCPHSLFYNPSSQQCDHQEIVDCPNDPGLPCEAPLGK